MRPSGSKLLVLTLALFALCLSGFLLWLWRTSLPQLSGTLSLQGLGQDVIVEREPSGVVHIRAGNDRDLLFAQGVVHAQDRLWQMEFQRRLGAGRLAELLGPDAVDGDRYLRTWGFLRSAEAAYQHLGPEARTLIDAYAAGINAYLASDPPLPLEFRLLRYRPEPWTVADVLVWTKMMAYNMADNRRSELRRYRLLARGLSPERVAALMPLYPGEQVPRGVGAPRPRALPADHRAEHLLALDAVHRRHLPRASNNWVVGSSRSASGMPLLANDVHLGMQMPSTWHLMHLQSPGFDVIGATLPGLPLVIIGRNTRIAWGVTNLAADVEDLYLVEERDAGHYVHQGEIRPYRVRDEVIRVRGGEPVTLRVRETVQGPVISDQVPNPKGAAPLALRWVGQDPDDTTIEAFLGINRARDWEDFRAALELYVVPGQNFVYADREGRIGYSASGRIPRRKPGHSGLYPVSGDGSWDWQGYLPFAELPYRLDPSEGFLATANNRITAPGYPNRLSLEWGAEPFRIERISERIEARAKHDLDSMRALQQDRVTLLHRMLRPLLKAIAPATIAGQRWRLRLLVWNGNSSAESVESTLFQAWYMAISTLPAEETGTSHWNSYPRFLNRALMQGDPACDRRGMTCLEFAADALDQVVATFADEPPPWGELHKAHLNHALLTHTPLAVLSDRVVSMGGGHYTVNVGWYRPEDWVMYHGPSYRQLIDMADPEGSLFVLAGGQSGNWLSPGYADQLPLWQRGDYLPMRLEGYAVAHELVLSPRAPDTGPPGSATPSDPSSRTP